VRLPDGAPPARLPPRPARATLAVALLAILAGALAPAARADPDAPLDVVFVLDTSGSMAWNDREGFRRDAVKALVDLVAEDVRGVAVTRFAGWTETERRGDAVLPFTPLPGPGPDLEATLERVRRAVDEGVDAFGSATDWNRALGAGIAPHLARSAADGRRAWVVLVTDGDAFEVSETDERTGADATRRAYVDAASAAGAPATPEALNAAALAELRERTLPALRREGVFVTALYLEERPPARASGPVLDAIAEGTRGPGRILRAASRDLRAGVLEVLASLPPGFLRARRPSELGRAAAEVRPGAPIEATLRRFPFASATRMAVFADSSAFEIEVLGPGGAPAEGTPGVRVGGAGARYRVISLGALAPPGDYRIVVRASGERPVAAEHHSSVDIDARPRVEAPAACEPGAPLAARVSLAGLDGAVIRDARFLEGLTLELWMRDASGARRALAPPRFAGEARAEVAIPLPPETPLGPCEVSARFRALRAERDGAGYESDVASARVLVCGRVEVEVSPAEAWEGGSASPEARVLAGPAAPRGLRVAITDPAGALHDLPLSREGEEDALSGDPVLLDVPGEWRVEAACDDPVALEVRTPVIRVRPRALHLRAGAPEASSPTPVAAALPTSTAAPLGPAADLDRVVLSLAWEAPSEAELRGTLSVDALPDEAARFDVSLPGAPAGIGARLEPLREGPSSAARLVVRAAHEPPAPRPPPGAHVLRASVVVGKVGIARDLVVEVAYPDRAAKERARRVRRLLALGLPSLALALAFLLLRRAARRRLERRDVPRADPDAPARPRG
jgi:hypothetical protein